MKGKVNKMAEIWVIAYDGFEETELVAPADLLMRAGNKVQIFSAAGNKTIRGSHGIELGAESLCAVKGKPLPDCIMLPGGLPNAHTLRDDPEIIALVQKAYREGKVIGAICAAPCVLERAGLLKGRRATSFPGALADPSECEYTGGAAEIDGSIVTGKGMGAAMEFGLTLIRRINGAEAAAKVAAASMYPHAV